MGNDAQEKHRQEELARRGVSTPDYRNHKEMKRIAQQERERAAAQKAAEHAANYNRPATRPSTPDGAGCFAAGTPVLSPTGWTNIESVRPGDLVQTVNPTTGATVSRTVLRSKTKHGVPIWNLCVDSHSEPILTTGYHRLLTQSGWKMVRQLRPGDRISAYGGGAAKVVSVSRTSRRETVYNLIAEGEFTYVVAGLVVDSLGVFRPFKAIWFGLTAKITLSSLSHSTTFG